MPTRWCLPYRPRASAPIGSRRPLTELGLAPGTAAQVLRVEAPPTWRWSTLDAAFLAGVLGDFERRARVLDVRGVPKELQSLLDLSRAGPMASRGASGQRRPDIRARLGALALTAAEDARLFVELLGQVVVLLPRYVGRPRADPSAPICGRCSPTAAIAHCRSSRS